jgi:hypothetical protein
MPKLRNYLPPTDDATEENAGDSGDGSDDQYVLLRGIFLCMSCIYHLHVYSTPGAVVSDVERFVLQIPFS